MGRDPPSHVAGTTIGDAYEHLLRSRVNDSGTHPYRAVHVADPVARTDYQVDSLDIDEWVDIVNPGDALSPFESYEFHDGSTGRFWVNDRIEELFDGMYADRLRTEANQLEKITERLQKGNHGQTTNALVASVLHRRSGG